MTTAQAHPNIAFIKYWGNRDHALRLPMNGSLSMNLAELVTETSVDWTDDLPADEVIINDETQTGKAAERVSLHLDHLRKLMAKPLRARVVSTNNFPMGAGIASSAAAFAALTVAGAAAAGFDLSERQLTTLARLGSGSAARSVPTGYVEWHAGDGHDRSYAESIGAPDHWDLVDVVAVISSGHKAVGSTEGHQSAETSDLQTARVAGAEERLATCKQALLQRDFATFAEVVERDSNMMHAVMMTSRPPLFYWLPASLTLMASVRAWRAEGLQVCYTLDAGPNVHCLCLSRDAEEIAKRVRWTAGVADVRVARVGGGAVVKR